MRATKWAAAALGCALGGLAPFVCHTPCFSELSSPPKLSEQSPARAIATKASERAVWLRKLQAQLNPSFSQELIAAPAPIVAANKPARQPLLNMPKKDSTTTVGLSGQQVKTLQQTDLSSHKLLQALTNALGNHTPPVVRYPDAHASDILPDSTGSPFAIQVATFPSLRLARRLQQELARKGHPAAVVQSRSRQAYGETGKQTAYHVRLHGFTSRAEAEQHRLRFQREEPRLTTLCVKQAP